jgi:hypothetical protein
MLAIKIIVLLLATLLFVVLFWPIHFRANSSCHRITLGYPWIFGVTLHFARDNPSFYLMIFTFKAKIKWLGRKSGNENNRKTNSTFSKIHKLSSFRLASQHFKQIKISRFIVSADTGDYSLNAQLSPLLTGINKDVVRVSTNYQGIVYFDILLQTRIINHLLIILKHSITNNKKH